MARAYGYGAAFFLFVAVVALAMAAPSTSAEDCTTVLTGLAPCIGYLSNSDKSPSKDCCSSLSNISISSPACLCSGLSSGGGGAAAGLNLNATREALLPKACKLNLDASQCKSLSSAPAPAPSHHKQKGHSSSTPSASQSTTPSANSTSSPSTSFASPVSDPSSLSYVLLALAGVALSAFAS